MASSFRSGAVSSRDVHRCRPAADA